MFLRQKILKNVENIVVGSRFLSAAQVNPLVDIAVDSEGIATLQIQRPPVNSFNLELLQAMRDALFKVEKNKWKGLVLTSVSPTIFSAGLDLMEIYKPEVTRLKQLKETLLDVVANLFGTDVITTVAINGYTGAGACVLALACEYRVMTSGKATIGINDTAVGIPPAKWVIDLTTRTMGTRHAEYALTNSFMFPAERAIQVGLIDEIATDKVDAVQKCKNFIKMYDNISSAARATTKRSLREKYFTELDNNRKQIVTAFVDTMTSAAVQDKIDQHVQNLRQKQAKS